MQKSFVFRDRDGRLCGYLVQQEGRINCKLYDNVTGVSLTAASEDGAVRRFELEGSAKEYTWDSGGADIQAAYVEQGGALLMDTGEEGRKLFRKAAADRQRVKLEKQGGFSEPAGGAAQEPEKQSAAGQPKQEAEELATDERFRKDADNGQNRVYPQRRWPPPVLMHAPIYVAGRWQDGCADEEG